MARDQPVRDPDGPDNTSDSVDEQHATTEPDGGMIDRRSYLKMASATAIAAGVGVSAASAAESDYEVIEARGQTIRVSSGETFENKLIDLGNGNDVTIVAKGTNWTIRNIGFTGTYCHDGTLLGVADTSGGTSLIENVYFGEGDPNASASERGKMIWVDPDHSGHLDVRNVNFHIEGANGIYGSAPGSNGNGSRGTIHIDGCYALNNHHTAYRFSSNGDKLTNSVVECTGANATNRGIWIWESSSGRTATIENVHSATNGYATALSLRKTPRVEASEFHYDSSGGISGDSSRLSLADSCTTNPETFVPEGCPTSAEEAASGGSSESDGSQPAADLPENTITFIGEGEPTNFYFETSGEIVQNPERGDLQTHDSIEGTSASGWVTLDSHVDSFRFDGELVDVGFEQGSARVLLNGEEIDPVNYSQEASTLDNLLLVDGVGTTGGTRYEFSVSGAVQKSNDEGASIDDEDVIGSGTVTGSVAGWRDAFRFSGELEDLTVDGDARIYVNDERVDPADYGEELPHVLTIVGNGTPSSYEISVDGSIDHVLGEDQDSSTISESTVEGSIERGVQRFRFSGTVSDVTFIDGSAHVYVDDERVDPDEIGDAELLPHAIVIDGTDTDGESSYSFSVDGDVIASNYRDATADESAVIQGSSVSGTVADSLDAYWFDGDIVDFQLNGDANVDVEYNVRSQ